MCLDETYNKVHVGQSLCNVFPVHNGLKQGFAVLLFLICHQDGSRKWRIGIEWNWSAPGLCCYYYNEHKQKLS